jgi:alkaline phosphatase D
MAIEIQRRHLFGLAAAGGGLMALPGWSQAPARGFTHGVASGEPGADRVLLWTRYVAPAESRLHAEMSERSDFSRIAGGGEVVASPSRDNTAKLVVTGLAPDRWYYYRFIGPDGARSETGRTRTLPAEGVAPFTLGVFSCANIGFGQFNAYGHAAARRDIDLMLHLGDYQYEYQRGTYPSTAETAAGRTVFPAGETIHLDDYRARYAAYRTDPQLRALHARFPMIMMWDDHESANDSWNGGAENHDPATEGEWNARKTAAVRAHREWMPVSEDDWAEYRIGDLAALFRPEERLTARTKQVDLGAVAKQGGDLAAALARFRDGPYSDPAHTLMEEVQERWFADRMRAAAEATRWQVFAQQVNVGLTKMPTVAREWAASGSPAVRAYIGLGTAAAAADLPFNMDSWNGYPAARSRLLRTGLDADANLVVLSGDSHNAWAFDLKEAGQPAGVEFGVQSVTSRGFEHELRTVAPKLVADALVQASPELRWADTSGRGYMTVRLGAERVDTEWLFNDTVARRSGKIARTHRAATQRNARTLTA